ncbi:MAG TPA: DNA polymerase III subunit gamma/tau, partial [Acidimicrobiales bacterium]|nr:DNA polymerase III subunit gamma/tau [Acidimicrobiales bacterium]
MPDPGDAEPAPYQSLYRRFRPQRFEDVLGQDHVSLALRNAARDGRVGHAYLFSGPRGTGKTSTARILAKALNCAAPEDGEPCGRCDSCVEIARGSSLDVHELDAASNNGVDAMRDLVSHAALGTPGRWKVYIVDEVHMLSTAASNALLKTLEEPPGHVVFVLATTDAQKVLPTIRSRTQHFEFRLLGSETLSGLVRTVRDASGLAVPDTVLDAAVRRGRGSARDALSALDQLSAGGAVDDDIEVLAELAGALAERDATRALLAVARAAETGRDPQRLAADLAEYLRQGFLAAMAPDLVTLAGDERAQVEELARRTGLPALVRCLEELGRAQVDMRDVPDPRVHLEVALIKLTHPQADDSAAALLERVDRLERALASLAGGAEPPPPPPRTAAPVAAPAGAPAPVQAEDPAPAPPPPAPGGDPGAGVPAEQAHPGGPDLARATLGAIRRQGGGAARRGAGRAAPAAPAPGGGEGGTGGDVP